MSKISERIRETALGPTPEPLFSCGVMVADWVGMDDQDLVLEWKPDLLPPFHDADDTTQRTFLLLVAEAWQ
jgi:hypothetical protein